MMRCIPLKLSAQNHLQQQTLELSEALFNTQKNRRGALPFTWATDYDEIDGITLIPATALFACK